MNVSNGKNHFTCSAEYDRHFWNAMKGSGATDTLSVGTDPVSGGYYLPANAEDKYSAAIRAESIFRNLATVVHAYTPGNRIFASDCADVATWVPEGGSIPLIDAINDFTRYPVDRHKLAIFVKLDNAFIHDATFDIEDYLMKRFAHNFAKAEDAAFVNGTGENAPTGILDSEHGATVGVTTSSISFDDVLQQFFALDPEYRKHAVWMMNDETALKLRRLTDSVLNPLWNHANDTILGKPVVISNDLPSEASGNIPLLFGDFRYYWIVCRSPVSVRTLKEKFVTLDQAGYLATEFMDGKLIRREAVQALQIA